MNRAGAAGRTPAGEPAGARRWVVTGVLCVALVALVVAMLLPTLRRQAQYAALRSRGEMSMARIEYCATASNSRPSTVTVTCPGSFVVGGRRVVEDILGLPAPVADGSSVAVLVDPHDVSDVYPQADVRSGYQSGWWKNDTLIAVVAVVLLGLTVASQVIVVRRRRSAR